MAYPDAAVASYSEQVRIVEAAAMAAAEVWRGLDPTNFSASWVQNQIGARLFLTTARAQELAAVAADTYTEMILAEAGTPVTPDALVIPTSLAGIASDGRPLDSLLLQPLITSSVATAAGATASEAMASGLAVLTRIVGTQVQDAGRAATSLSIAARQRTGWVRLVNPGACSRCVVLAGRWYRWSDGFLRHPLCHCKNIPAREDTPELTTASDPMTHFNALTEKEQNKQFTVAGAQAIRDGASIMQVVNARRSAVGLASPGRLTREEQKILKGGRDRGRLERTDVYGQKVFITREGTTKRGVAGKLLIEQGGGTVREPTVSGRRLTRAKTPRLMPESIYELATDREDALRLLRRFGYMK